MYAVNLLPLRYEKMSCNVAGSPRIEWVFFSTFTEKTIDLSSVNLKKLKVKDLKQILSDWDAQCKGCTEKQDYIKMIEELMPKHDPKAWEKRQKTEL